MVPRGWECSHSIRSEILLRYWCPDIFSQLFQIYIFDQEKAEKKTKTSKIFDFSDFFQKKLIDRKKYFLKKLEKSGHQYRSKISLRIEWEHSQPLGRPGNTISRVLQKYWILQELADGNEQDL